MNERELKPEHRPLPREVGRAIDNMEEIALTSPEPIAGYLKEWAGWLRASLRDYRNTRTPSEPVAYRIRRRGSKEWTYIHGNLAEGEGAELSECEFYCDLLYPHPAPSDEACTSCEKLDRQLTQILTERDEYHDKADELAGAISEYFGVDIGEHSNCNCPWDNALEEIQSQQSPDTEARRLLAEVEPFITNFAASDDLVNRVQAYLAKTDAEGE